MFIYLVVFSPHSLQLVLGTREGARGADLTGNELQQLRQPLNFSSFMLKLRSEIKI